MRRDITNLSRTLLSVGIIFISFLPLRVFAVGGLYVPVSDDNVASAIDLTNDNLKALNFAFKNYAENFKNYIYDDSGRSIRALLSLNPPTGQAAQLYLPGKFTPATGGKSTDPVNRTDSDTIKATINNACSLRPITNSAQAMPKDGESAWSELLKKGYIGPQYADYSATRVNDSTSLTCLLQEMVEQNKLDLNLKIHQLLRDYITTAQATQLAQRASGMIAKANLDWAKSGIKNKIYDSDGKLISEEDYSVLGNDPNAYQNSLTQARARTLQQRILAPSDQPDSLQICGSDKYTVARNLLTQANTQTADPLDTLSSQVSCSLTNQSDPSRGLFANESGYNQFVSTDGGGNQGDSFDTLQSLILNDKNTGPGLAFALSDAQAKQISQIRDDANQQYVAAGGYLPARQCDPNDPNCDPRYSEISTPGRLVGDMVSGYVQQPDKQLANAKTPEDLSSVDTSVNNSPSEKVLQQGLDNVDSSALLPNQDTAKYIGDFMNTIQSGYFDLQSGTTDWAAGAMLKIYDTVMTNPQAYQNKNTLDPSDTTGDVSTTTVPTP